MGLLMFKPEIVIQLNEKTSIRAFTFDESDEHIIIRKGKADLGMTHRNHIDTIMHRYGTSKVMHWNDRCAAPNANKESSRIRMLDGRLRGFTVCRNCWDRTRSFNN